MTLSIRTTLRSLSVLALTAAFLPGCDGEEYEALGLSSEEIDAMSEEELDELAASEDAAEDDDLEHSVYQRPLRAPLPGPDPVPSNVLGTNPPAEEPIGPETITAPMQPTHSGPHAVDVPDTLWDPQYTHTGPHAVDVPDTLWDPQYTHTGKDAVDVPDTLWDPQHTHTGEHAVDVPDTLWDPQHTHSEIPGVVAGLAVPTRPDPGCQPYSERPQLTNG